MLIYVKIIKKKKKKVFYRTDGRTDTRSTQNYSSEPHKKKLFTDRLTDGRTTQNYSSEPHKNSNKKVEL